MPHHGFLIHNQYIKNVSIIFVFHDSSMIEYFSVGSVFF